MGSGKKPLVKWRRGRCDYVFERPTDEEVRTWLEQRPDGWAVLCGGPMAVVVLDVEAAG
ncbi:hypothetical protein [Ornithinimicrobium cryptoxanthini]|uniref:Uncharacterized protein n=1 Tax=Ornithinimicrobium cryptoxanthini TaxID=2934161 RepID=A0ABY4YF08_9MICO|nr:hypothetical protein [Ornithinimicrobium cryptoxanthini]USQ75358.1 hypothetical protein NF557_12090 [Ornithinimicrobium cryptoxanthini]